MDFTKKNRIRPDKDFNKIAKAEYGKLFRKDSEDIFKEMIIEKDLNDFECIIIRDYFFNAILNIELGGYTRLPKTSYYHIALELVQKLQLTENYTQNLHEITKRNKLNQNEVECMMVYIGSILSLGLTMATLKYFTK